MRIRLAIATASMMVPTAAFAHPGHPSGLGFADGILHPLTGADHLVAALLVGALAALSRSTRSALGAFLAALAAGLLSGDAFPQVAAAAELGILLGFAALAAAFLLRESRAGFMPAGAAVTGFTHGLAHGSEGEAAVFAAGVLAATAALAGAGYLVARLSSGSRRTGASALR